MLFLLSGAGERKHYEIPEEDEKSLESIICSYKRPVYVPKLS